MIHESPVQEVIFVEVREFKIEPEDEGKRLDSFLTEKIEGYSRTYMQKLIDEGHCKVRGKDAKPRLKLREGDQVEVTIPDPVPLEV